MSIEVKLKYLIDNIESAILLTFVASFTVGPYWMYSEEASMNVTAILIISSLLLYFCVIILTDRAMTDLEPVE